MRLLGQTEVKPGEACLAQIFLNQPAVAVWNQPFVIRNQSPVETIGGGRVLAPNSRRLKKPSEFDLKMVGQLSSDDPVERASASVYLADDLNWTADQLSRSAGIVDTAAVFEQLKTAGEVIEIQVTITRTVIIHKARFDQLTQRVMKTLERMHAQAPLRFNHPRSALAVEFNYLDQPELLDLVVDDLKKQKKVNANVNTIGLVGYGPKLSKGQKALLSELVATLRSAGTESPTVSELVKKATKNKESVAELLDMAAENGDAVKVNDDYYLHAEVMEGIKSTLAAELMRTGGLTMSEIRQVLDTSRKFAIPICEYFDRVGFTVREGDKRLLSRSENES